MHYQIRLLRPRNLLLQFISISKWAVAGSMINNASAAGYTDNGIIVNIWITGPYSNITTQDWYKGTFTRLDRLLGNTLDYYWI